MAHQATFSGIAPYVEDQFVHLDRTVEANIAHAIISADSSLWFVVESMGLDHVTQMLVMSGEELLEIFADHRRGFDGNLSDGRLASMLSAIPASYELDAAEVLTAGKPTWVDHVAPVGQRTVIVDGGVPVGVVAAPEPPSRPGPRWLSGGDGRGTAGVPKKPNHHDPDPAKPLAEGPTADRVEQHILAETVSQLRTNDANELRVTVSGIAESGVLDNQQTAAAFVDPTVALMMVVRDRGSVRLDDHWQAAVDVQGVDEATTRTFGYRAVGTGPGWLSVSLFSHTEEVATLELNLIVTGDPQPEDQGNQQAEVVAAVEPGGGVRNTLLIDWRNDSTLLFDLVVPGTGATWHRDETVVAGATRAAGRFLQTFEAVRGTRRSFEQYQQAEMVGLGAMLAEVLPDDIKDPLWEQRDTGHGTELLSTLATWPWELCCLANSRGELPTERPFLGERGLTRRRPGTPHPLTIRTGGRRVVSAPDYSMMRAMNLRAGAEEATHLQERFGFTDGPTGTGNLTALLNDGDFSIFHFAGHSVIPDRADGDWGLPKLVLNDSKFVGDGGKDIRSALSPTMLRRRSMDTAAPLVFLNACTTGGLYDTPGGGNAVRGFPDGFLAAGAGAFIGTHWEVEDGPAQRFAESFYVEFLENGNTLTDAVSSARHTAGSDGWSPSPLAYVAYGHPDAKAVDE